MLAKSGSKDYLEMDKQIFDAGKVDISYHNYSSIKYNQHGETFLKDLSLLDLLFSQNQNSKAFISCYKFSLYLS